MRIPAAGEDHKCAVFGAVDYASGRVWYQFSARKGEDAFAAFLDQLAHELPTGEPAILVLDNVGYHKSHQLREQWQHLSERFAPFFLPAYSPQLNLIERLGRYLKDHLACHRWWNDLARLQQATETLLTGLEVHFHAPDGPAFRFVHNFCESA
jgi:transposase